MFVLLTHLPDKNIGCLTALLPKMTLPTLFLHRLLFLLPLGIHLTTITPILAPSNAVFMLSDFTLFCLVFHSHTPVFAAGPISDRASGVRCGIEVLIRKGFKIRARIFLFPEGVGQ